MTKTFYELFYEPYWIFYELFYELRRFVHELFSVFREPFVLVRASFWFIRELL